MRADDIVASTSRDRDTSVVSLLTVGRLEAEKNPLLLVDALARLEADEPGRYRLTWVGRGPLEEQVTRRIREHGLAERVTPRSYVPFGPELLELYRDADLFVHVSLSEGLPKVLIEAFASATPIVATDVGGVRSAVDDGRAAVLVLLPISTPWSPESTDSRMTSAPGRMRQRGLELVRNLTLEAQAERVARFIRSCAGGGPSTR